MIDAVGNPQSLLLLGGTSEIGLAIAERYARRRPLRVVLAARPSPRLDAAAEQLRDRRRHGVHSGVRGDGLRRPPGDAGQGVRRRRHRRHGRRVRAARRRGAGLAGPRARRRARAGELHRRRCRSASRWPSGCAGRATAGSSRCRRSPASGCAGRTSCTARRRPAWTASTSGSARRCAARASRSPWSGPGFVHTKMTEGMKPAPLSATPEDVAAVVVDAVAKRKELVWAPAPLRVLMSVLRHIPRADLPPAADLTSAATYAHGWPDRRSRDACRGARDDGDAHPGGVAGELQRQDRRHQGEDRRVPGEPRGLGRHRDVAGRLDQRVRGAERVAHRTCGSRSPRGAGPAASWPARSCSSPARRSAPPRSTWPRRSRRSGADTEAMHMVTGYIPEPEDEDDERQGRLRVQRGDRAGPAAAAAAPADARLVRLPAGPPGNAAADGTAAPSGPSTTEAERHRRRGLRRRADLRRRGRPVSTESGHGGRQA